MPLVVAGAGWLRLLTCCFLLSAATLPALAQLDQQSRKLSRDIFQQLIEINTTDSVGSTTVAANAMAQRLLDAGFAKEDVLVLGPNDRKGNLVARFHGTGRAKPILFIGHLDVVEALRSDWTTDPFQFVEKDGYFYGRGAQDMKESDAILVTTFIRLKKEGYQPDRDLILALTADEEGGKSNGVDWLLKNHRDLIEAAFVLNSDAGGVDMEHGKAITFNVEASEKLYGDYQLTAVNPGGHSSLPVPDNAIYHIADSLTRLQAYTFPFELNPVTRAYFASLSKLESGQTATDMAAIVQDPPADGGHRASVPGPQVQRHHAHHLRRHPSVRRRCQQRLAADRGSQRQLPDSPRSFAGRDSPAAYQDLRRSQGHRSLRQRQR